MIKLTRCRGKWALKAWSQELEGLNLNLHTCLNCETKMIVFNKGFQKQQGRSNQSILKELSPEYSLKGLTLKLKLQYFGLLDVKSQLTGTRPWCWERLKAGEEGSDRGWDGWMASSTQWTWAWANSGRWWRTGMPGMLQSVVSQRVGHNWATNFRIKNTLLWGKWNILNWRSKKKTVTFPMFSYIFFMIFKKLVIVFGSINFILKNDF